jgi:hypothetical protein
VFRLVLGFLDASCFLRRASTSAFGTLSSLRVRLSIRSNGVRVASGPGALEAGSAIGRHRRIVAVAQNEIRFAAAQSESTSTQTSQHIPLSRV